MLYLPRHLGAYGLCAAVRAAGVCLRVEDNSPEEQGGGDRQSGGAGVLRVGLLYAVFPTPFDVLGSITY